MIKKLLIIILLVVTQHVYSQTKFGLTAGANLSNVHYQLGNDDELSTKSRSGYMVGFMLEFKLNEKLFLQSGLRYNNIGYEDDLEADLLPGESIDGYSKTSLNYADIPIVFAYKEGKIQFLLGGYVGVGISGENTFDYTQTDPSGSVVVKGDFKVQFDGVKETNFVSAQFSEPSIGIDRLDYGLNAGIGYQLGAFIVALNYRFGLNNISPNVDALNNSVDDDISNRGLGLSLTYVLSKQ